MSVVETKIHSEAEGDIPEKVKSARQAGGRAEAVNDCFKLMMHRIIVRRISEDPSLIQKAMTVIGEEDELSPDYIGEWRRLLSWDPSVLRRRLVERTEEMYRLRLSSPFTVVVDFQDQGLRRRMYQAAKRLTYRDVVDE